MVSHLLALSVYSAYDTFMYTFKYAYFIVPANACLLAAE